MASIAEHLKKYTEDALWPLKMFRGRECDYNHVPAGHYSYQKYLGKNKDFSDPTRYRSDDKYRLLNAFAEEGEQLCEQIRGGMGLVLNPAEQDEIRLRYPDEATKQRKEGSYGVEEEWKQLPSKTVGSFYGEKFRRIIQEQSRLELLREEEAITDAAYQKGIAATVHDLDRLGFHGFTKMIEATPALKDYLLSEATLRADTIDEALTARDRWQGGDRLREKLRVAETQLPQNPDAVEKVYQEFLGGKRVEATRARINYVDEWLAKYEQYKDRLETPNAELIEAMKSADATLKREAEKTFLMKHFYPITDLRLGEEYPQLKEVQQYLLGRIREESHIVDRSIEELFARPDLSHASDHPQLGGNVIEGKVVARQIEETVTPPPASETGETEAREALVEEKIAPPPAPEPSVVEDVVQKAEDIGGLESSVKTEETIATAAKKAFSKPQKLGFAAAAVALVGTLGWLAFRKIQEEKGQPTLTEKSPAR